MNKRTSTTANRLTLMIAASLLALGPACNTGRAYETYTDCFDCHGDFRGSTSTKTPATVFPSNNNHEMHRATDSMDTDCNICHTGTSSTRKPVYTFKSNGTTSTANDGLGCSGCHVGPGLRKHHSANGVTECYPCHDPSEVAAPEDVSPPYYSGTWTSLTKVRNPGNTVLVANTNENWSIGDFLGLDNDGNNLYDAADFAITPYQILGAAKEGNNVRITWLTAGGRTDAVQASVNVAGSYSNLSSALTIPGVGVVTTNYLDVNGATNFARFYRLMSVP